MNRNTKCIINASRTHLKISIKVLVLYLNQPITTATCLRAKNMLNLPKIPNRPKKVKLVSYNKINHYMKDTMTHHNILTIKVEKHILDKIQARISLLLCLDIRDQVQHWN